MRPGVRRFVDDMTALGLDTTVEAGFVIYRIAPVDGARAGTEVETGVSTEELDRWPQMPPHWIYLPAAINFSQTNSQPSPKSGWLMHSREFTGWGDAPPGKNWVSHVRSVLGEAIA